MLNIALLYERLAIHADADVALGRPASAAAKALERAA